MMKKTKKKEIKNSIERLASVIEYYKMFIDGRLERPPNQEAVNEAIHAARYFARLKK